MEQVQPPRGLHKDYVKIKAQLVECESDEFKAVKHRVNVSSYELSMSEIEERHCDQRNMWDSNDTIYHVTYSIEFR
jgi:hypothetical protein